MLQRPASKREGPTGVPSIVHEVLRSGGAPLEASARAHMETRFGYDFSPVRVHTSARAAKSAQAVNALAYTVGSNIVFDAGRYAPATLEGQRLLAHELTHTIQQGAHNSQVPSRLETSRPTDAAEVEADRIAGSIAHAPDKEGANNQTPINDAVASAPALMKKGGVEIEGSDDDMFLGDAYKYNYKDEVRAIFPDVQYFLGLPLVYPRELYWFKGTRKFSNTEVTKEIEEAKKKGEADATAQKHGYVPSTQTENWDDIIKDISQSVWQWQIKYNDDKADTEPELKEDGMLTKATVDIMRKRGLTVADKSLSPAATKAWEAEQTKKWAEVDKQDWKAVRADETANRKETKDTSDDVREKIIDLARSQIGKVLQAPRGGDKKKFGWERILRYYEVASGTHDVLPQMSKPDAGASKEEQDKWKENEAHKKEAESFTKNFGENKDPSLPQEGAPVKQTRALERLQTGGIFAFTDKDGELPGPWSWCGIFTMWAAKAVTGKGYWLSGSGPQGLTKITKSQPSDFKKAQKGDILGIDSTNNHHVILAEDPAEEPTADDHFRAIEGNLELQEVRDGERWQVKNVVTIYKTVD